MTAQLELLESPHSDYFVNSVEKDRDEAMRAIIAHAGQRFRREAEEFVLAFLQVNGETPGEFITDACKAAGIVPHDDRAFGPVYMALSRRGLIEKVASCQRRKGHGTNGGIVWRLREFHRPASRPREPENTEKEFLGLKKLRELGHSSRGSGGR